MNVAGLNVNFSDVYKPHGFKERCALLREDVFDLLIISAPPSLIPWTTERVGYIRHFIPSLPIPGSTSFSTIDSTQQSSLRGSSLTLETDVSQQSLWKSSLKTISESEVALDQFIEILKQFFTSQTFNRKKNTVVHKLLHLFLPNLFCLEREDIQMEIQCLLTLSNPHDLLVKVRRLIQCPFIKATILPSRRELQAIACKLNEDFRSILTPRRTPTGFRVNLVTFVRFVACNLYNKKSLIGLRVDIYGDAMSRGKKDVVRMAFRILQSGIETEQSSTHVFTFAVFEVSRSSFTLKIRKLIYFVSYIKIHQNLYRETKFGSCRELHSLV
jgi:hypothetical protein